MKTIQENEIESLSVEQQLEDCIEEYIRNICKEYPQTSLLEITSKMKLQITDELKKTKYGNHVKTLIDKKVLADWCDHSISIKSVYAVKKLENRFNTEDKNVAKSLMECQKGLLELSTGSANFTINSEQFIRLLQRFLRSFQNTVDSLTMCIFLCIKFIFSIHRHHARADMKSEHFSANEIDFENYIVKNVEPLSFPSLNSKLTYIVPLFATLLQGDDFSDLAKLFAQRCTKL